MYELKTYKQDLNDTSQWVKFTSINRLFQRSIFLCAGKLCLLLQIYSPSRPTMFSVLRGRPISTTRTIPLPFDFHLDSTNGRPWKDTGRKEENEVKIVILLIPSLLGMLSHCSYPKNLSRILFSLGSRNDSLLLLHVAPQNFTFPCRFP